MVENILMLLFSLSEQRYNSQLSHANHLTCTTYDVRNIHIFSLLFHRWTKELGHPPTSNQPLMGTASAGLKSESSGLGSSVHPFDPWGKRQQVRRRHQSEPTLHHQGIWDFCFCIMITNSNESASPWGWFLGLNIGKLYSKFYSLMGRLSKKSAKLWTLSKQGGGVKRSDEMSKPS